MFPELEERGTWYSVQRAWVPGAVRNRGGDSYFLLVVTRRARSDNTSIEPPQLLLRAQVVRGQDGYLERMFPEAGGVLGSRRSWIVRDFLRDHREWSDAQVAERLRAEGAQFGPDQRDRLIATVSPKLTALAAALGAIQTEEISFQTWFEQGEREHREPMVTWAWWIRAGGSKGRVYRLDFDPFDGHLLGIARHPERERR